MIDNTNNSIITQWYTDANGNPISVKTEQKTQASVGNGLVQLEGIPDEMEEVRIEDKDGVIFSRVDNLDEVYDNEHAFFLMNDGRVKFNPIQDGQELNFKYYSKGVTLLSVSRLYYKDSYDNVVKILEYLIKKGFDALKTLELFGGAKEVIERVEKDITDGTNLATRLETIINIGKPIDDSLKALVPQAQAIEPKLKADNTEANRIQPILHADNAEANRIDPILKETIRTATDMDDKIKTTGNTSLTINVANWVDCTTGRAKYQYEYVHTIHSIDFIIDARIISVDGHESGQIDNIIKDDSHIIFYTEEKCDVKINLNARQYNGSRPDYSAITADNISEGVNRKYVTTAEKNEIAKVGNKQDKTDNLLQTNDKTISGAINEVNTKSDSKVDKVSGKGLSTNDYTASDKNEVIKVANKADITYVDTKVATISSGTPLFASSVNGMTDKSKNYVNTTDGYLYTYNGTTFVKSAIMYQSQGIEDKSIVTEKMKFVDGYSLLFRGLIDINIDGSDYCNVTIKSTTAQSSTLWKMYAYNDIKMLYGLESATDFSFKMPSHSVLAWNLSTNTIDMVSWIDSDVNKQRFKEEHITLLSFVAGYANGYLVDIYNGYSNKLSIKGVNINDNFVVDNYSGNIHIKDGFKIYLFNNDGKESFKTTLTDQTINVPLDNYLIYNKISNKLTVRPYLNGRISCDEVILWYRFGDYSHGVIQDIIDRKYCDISNGDIVFKPNVVYESNFDITTRSKQITLQANQNIYILSNSGNPVYKINSPTDTVITIPYDNWLVFNPYTGQLEVQVFGKVTKGCLFLYYNWGQGIGRGRLSDLLEADKLKNKYNEDTVPSFLQNMVKNKLVEIRNLQRENPNRFSFVYISDTHLKPTINYTSAKVINELEKEIDLKFYVNCGDISFNSLTDKEFIFTNMARNISKINKKEKLFITQGNHDANYAFGGAPIVSLNNNETYAMMFKHLEGKVAMNPNDKQGLYYYYDIPNYNIRCFFLNPLSILMEKGSDGINVQKDWNYYTNAQLNFIKDGLESAKDGCQIAFFQHYSLTLNIPKDPLNIGNREALIGMINAYQSGGNYSNSSGTGNRAYSVNFNRSGKTGNVVGMFAGHSHYDWMGKDLGINNVCLLCDRLENEYSEMPVRTEGTETEIAFDVVTVDPDQKKVWLTRMGAGSNREFTY